MKINEQTGQLEMWFNGFCAGKRIDRFLKENPDLQLDEWRRYSNGSIKCYFSPID